MKKMPAVGLSTMEYILRALFIFCLGFTSHATSIDLITSPLPANGPEYSTTFDGAVDDVTTVVNEETYTTSESRVEKDNKDNDEDLLLTTNVDGLLSYTTDIVITTNGKQTRRRVVNKTTNYQSNTTSPLTTTDGSMTSSKDGVGFYTEESHERNTQTTEGFSAKTLHPAVAFTRDLSTTTLKPTVKAFSTKENTSAKFTSSQRLEKATESSQRIPPTVTSPKPMVNGHTKHRFDIDGPIGEDLEKDFNKPISELSGHTKGFVEQTYYERSPEYIQRQTINHAAIWITVGFVAILLTYILALFIHEKGRSEWRMATQDYSRFENESDVTHDDTSITIDLDSSSAPPSTSTAMTADKTQDITLEPQVVDTTRSH
ncbi:hypothetical protein HOLleu_38740 [Holothuria leucospilota]|uniref:Uncharacterized protein n=1 Tax=Holothuria leucospilota TaxID=206669 RepID=A0A9Q0YEZ0_HOLLE|nr:hypothetical protein HOLleu_38740 [Holothuria leucospilota]